MTSANLVPSSFFSKCLSGKTTLEKGRFRKQACVIG